MRVPLERYSGCGNSFYLFDNRQEPWSPHFPHLVPTLCKNGLHPNTDGVILLENDPYADFRMVIYNADGSEAEMCGNGLRCLLRFLTDLNLPQKKYTIATSAGSYQGRCLGDQTEIIFPRPSDAQWNLSLDVSGTSTALHYLNTGVPHVVIFREEIDSVDLATFAPQLRHHPRWGTSGANVNIATILENGTIRLRTYERGVEGETLACGTGAIATAFAAQKLYSLPSPIEIIPMSGEKITIELNKPHKMTAQAVKIDSQMLEVAEKEQIRYNPSPDQYIISVE